MTFDEYWKSEYPPLYDVGKAVARAAASLDADENRAVNAILSDINADCMQAIENNKMTIIALEAENARLRAEVEAAENLIHYCDIPKYALPEQTTYQQARAARLTRADGDGGGVRYV